MASRLKLNVDALEVTSFDADGTAGERGTVLGADAESKEPWECPDNSFLTGDCCEFTWAVSCGTGCDECTIEPRP